MSKLARLRVGMRKRKQARDEKKKNTLLSQRNKALKEASAAISKAKDREDLADAIETRQKAQARLRATKKENVAKAQIKQGARRLFALAKDVYEEDRKQAAKERKKTTKRSRG